MPNFYESLKEAIKNPNSDKPLSISLLKFLDDVKQQKDLTFFDNNKIFPSKLHFTISKLVNFDVNQQQDAHGFMQIFFEILNDELSMKINENEVVKQMENLFANEIKLIDTESFDLLKQYISTNNSIITKTFCGLLQKKIKCNCGKRTKFEFFFEITLQIPPNYNQKRIKLKNLLEFYQIEEVTKDVCSKCKDQFTHKLDISKLPDCFILILPKNQQILVEFPHVLDFEKDKQYHLFNVIYHSGKNNFNGHFLSITKVGTNNWFKFDDLKYSQVDEIVMNGAFMLVYNKAPFQNELKQPPIIELKQPPTNSNDFISNSQQNESINSNDSSPIAISTVSQNNYIVMQKVFQIITLTSIFLKQVLICLTEIWILIK